MHPRAHIYIEAIGLVKVKISWCCVTIKLYYLFSKNIFLLLIYFFVKKKRYTYLWQDICQNFIYLSSAKINFAHGVFFFLWRFYV
jgi:hypothetical protein